MAWRLCCESGIAHKLGKLVYGRERLTRLKEHAKGADYAMSARLRDDTLLIVCRGTIGFTDNPNDWLNNLGTLLVPLASGKSGNVFSSMYNRVKNRKNPLVHSGFYDAANNLLESLTKELISFRNSTPNGKVFLTGHSKGGAMAQILAAQVADLGFAKEQIEVITFGSPKVGNHAFTEYIMEKAMIKNIVNDKDAVPSLLIGNYKHVPSILKIPDTHVDAAKNEGFTQFRGMVAAHFMAYTFHYYPTKKSRELLKRMNPKGFEAVYSVFENNKVQTEA